MGSQKMNLKKIKIEELKVGMFIEDLDRSWFKHPFLTNKKRITSQEQIEKLRAFGILEVYIDPKKGLDFQRDSAIQEESVFSSEEIVGHIEERQDASQPPSLPEEIPLEEELGPARIVQQEAHTIIRDVMEDVRLGKNVESEKVKYVVSRMIESIFRNRDALASLTRIKEYDDYTFVHSINVCILCLTLGRHLNFHPEELQQIGIGALLHDAGKMKVPLQILNKPGKVTEQEFFEIKKHPLYSMEVLEKAGGIPEASKQVALQHHERYNGKGYPYNLQGEEISKFGQISAIVDVYDAITSDRVYKKALSPYEGMQKIYEWAKIDFNQTLVERFIQCVGIYPIGTFALLDTGEMGIVSSINHEKLLRPNIHLIYQNFKMRYPQPIVVDLMEKSGDSREFKRTIITPLDPTPWNIHVDDYLPGLKNDLKEGAPKEGTA
jgi:HD-GYP domain-containing protein (c-di-GMP phosphodiesterase class II)